jgi:hypothetical protein
MVQIVVTDESAYVPEKVGVHVLGRVVEKSPNVLQGHERVRVFAQRWQALESKVPVNWRADMP